MQNIIPEITSLVTAKSVELLVSRSAVGLEKYGVTLDNAKLTPRQLIEHAREEAADQLEYLTAALIAFDEAEKSGENTLKTASKSPQPQNPNPSNAVFLPLSSLFLLNLNEFTKSVEYTDFMATFRKYFAANEHAAKVLRNLLDNMEADRLLANPNEQPSPDFMLRMVGEVNKNVEAPHAIQRMFEACGRTVVFGDQTKLEE